MSRCICCNSQLPSSTVYRTILIPHPTKKGETTTLRVEEDFCSKCSVQSNMNYNSYALEETTLEELGLVSSGFSDY